MVNDGELKLSEEVLESAKQKVLLLKSELAFEFVQTVKLGNEFKEAYWVQLIRQMLVKKDYLGAAKLMIAAKVTKEFDCFEIVAGLIQMGKKDVAKLLINATSGEQQKTLVYKVVIYNANDSHY
jgi:hypothetical protein